MACNCQIQACDEADGSETIEKKIVTAKTRHRCCECGVQIWPGDAYEKYVGVSDGVFFKCKTCLDCVSLRDNIFCSYYFHNILDDLRAYIDDNDCNIAEDCIANLTKTARNRVCDMIEECWEDQND